MEPGTVMCYKTTGELCIVMGNSGSGGIAVRRPVMSHENGISHITDDVADFELETPEAHLRREANEMVLKVKIQNEMQEELEKTRKNKEPLELVN